ncbi:MAG TPA: hypothetical protein VMW54_12790 [Terriglobia bacterium]|nr:hypothetical protein [Terriglobia bacterium]
MLINARGFAASEAINCEVGDMAMRKRFPAAGLLPETHSSERRTLAWRYAAPVLAFICFFICSNKTYARQASEPAREINWHAMGSTPCAWSPPVLDARGAIDSEATIRILKAKGLSCYGALIWRQREHGSVAFDWGSFKQFVAAAAPAGIDVWAILIPPSEGGDSPPFNRDYVRWMQELAKLSLRYPNLRGVNIDDYLSGTSKKTFTPAYTCNLYHAKQAINPKLQFAPTLYDLDRPLAEQYGGCVDGVWLWWTNLDMTTGLASWLENTRLAVQGRFPIYSGIYGHGSSWHRAAPKPGVLRGSLETACRYARGAIIWQMPLSPPNPLLQVARSFGVGGSSPAAGRCGRMATRP